MAGWHAGDVEANGIVLHYTRTGGDKPPVVLLHGVTDDGLCWTPVAEALAPTYDLIMIDARGHGRSAAPVHGYDPATQAGDVAGVITALGLHRPAILGHSMGAATTLVLAGTYPDLPGAILLEDPPDRWTGPPEHVSPEADGPAETDASAESDGRAWAEAERLEHRRAWFTTVKGQTRADLIAAQRATMPGWSEAELGPWAEAKLRVSPHVLAVYDPRTQRSVDWITTLRRISCPALLITADPALGAILTAEGAAALQALVPQLRIAHIPGAGHNIRREQFTHYLNVVRSFLAPTRP